MRRLRAGFVTPAPGKASGPRAYGHYDPCAGSLLDGRIESPARKRGPRASADKRNAPHENAAVKRRKARRSASSDRLSLR